MTLIETPDGLRSAPLNAVLVDRIGLAWQVTAIGADTSWHKGVANTRRNGFVQAGNHVVYEVAAMGACLPMRIVDDGAPWCFRPEVSGGESSSLVQGR